MCYKADPRRTETRTSPDSYDLPNCRSLSSHLPDVRDGDDGMKKLFLILIASVALVMAHGVYASESDGGGGIPLSKLAGRYL